MSNKGTFTLHPEYKDFVPGVTPLNFDTLSVSAKLLGCVLPLTLFSFALLVLMTAFFYSAAIKPLVFRLLGQEITAQVLDCQMFKTTASSLSYVYSWEGQEFKNFAPFLGEDRGDCNQYLNQPIPIRVMPFDPSQSYLATGAVSFSSALFCAMGLFMFLVLYRLCHAYIQYVRARWTYPRLTQRGILIEGHIKSISADRSNKSSTMSVIVRYEFESPGGKTLKGSARAHHQDKDRELPPVGTPVAVLYADDHAHMML